MMFYNWNIKFVLPIHFLRTFLANGVLFTNEFREMKDKSQDELAMLKKAWSRKITSEALGIADMIIQNGNVSQR